jgi:hypothetical protein
MILQKAVLFILAIVRTWNLRTDERLPKIIQNWVQGRPRRGEH